MYKIIPLLCLVLCGCQYNTVSHMSAQGAMTQNTNIAFLTRSHSRIQTQQGNPNPLPAAEPVLAPNTASNTTGLEGVLNAQSLGRNYPQTEVQSTVDINGKTSQDFFTYDNDTDSEPAVRVMRIGTAGFIAGKIIN